MFLSFTRLNGKHCERDIAVKPFELRKILTPMDKGMFLVVHPRSTLSLRHYGATAE